MINFRKTIKHKNFPIRIFFLILFIIPLIYFNDFYQHFYVYLTGNIITLVIRDQWHIVLVSIALFLAFLIPLSYRRKADWVEKGMVSAFFISLFVEMYGIPLTILFASKYFYKAGILIPANVINFNILGVSFGMDLAMAYGEFLMILGIMFIVTGWVTLYKNIKKNEIVENGIYSYSRHPQYLGFILIILGWLVGWPTILTLILTPILIYKYVQVSRKEEEVIGNEYRKYKKNVPFFV